MPHDDSTSGQQAGGATSFSVPALSGQEIYDSIMIQIEPELTTALLPLMKEKYKNETPEEAKVRAARYDKAYAEYEVRFAQYQASWDQQLHRAVSAIKKQQEQQSQVVNEQELGAIDDAISNA